MRRRSLFQASSALGMGALAGCALPGVARGLAGPAAAAPAVVDQTWTDTARRRELPLRLRLPSGLGPWPLVLYWHGLGGGRDGGDRWGEAWCAAGFVVIHLQHPGSDFDVLRAGPAALRAAASAEQLNARLADVGFVLDEVARRARTGTRPWSQVRLDATGVAGHSFGAQTTQAIAGQRFAVPTSLADSRPLAFIALSPSTTRARLPVAQQFGAITRPFMAITGSLDADPFGSFDSGEPRARIYDGLPPGQRALLWLDGADHMTFAGNAGRRIAGSGLFERAAVAQQRERRHHALVARLTTLWWAAHLQGDASARSALARAQGLLPGDRLVLD